MDYKKDTGQTAVEILVAEDSPTQAEQLKYSLEQNGYEVHVAKNGKEALDCIEKRMPAIVLSDVLMPEMDGYELCKKIKSDPGLNHIAVVLLTTLSDPEDVIRGLECGADNFITKPYDEKLLLSRLQYIFLNMQIRRGNRSDLGIEIMFRNKKYMITSSRIQILDLLLSTYENAIMKNREVEKVNRTLKERTGELTVVNAALQSEIADRKRAEKALVTSERKYRDLFEDIQLLAVMLDNQGHITFCNDYLLNITGWLREEVLNKNWFELFLPDNLNGTAYSMFIAGISKGDLPSHYDNTILTREGNPKYIVWDNSILRDSEGQAIGTASIGTDVTEHRKLEEQLRQAQKMEAIGTLAGGVAHDFNNILTAIIGFGTMAQKRVKDDEKTRQFIGEMLIGANRAAELTHGLLAFSRKQTISLKRVDLNAIAKRMHTMIVRIIGEDIELKTVLVNRELPVRVDEAQIEQVLLNLVTNARDAMPEGGYLVIQTEEISINRGYVEAHFFESPGEYAVLTVSDTGIGMDLKTRENIFEPFFTTKGVGKGTGLGLSMAYGTIKQHNGNINVYSEVGKGTTFRVYLPLALTGEEAISKPVETPPKGKGETIIIAEDDPHVRDIISLLLQDNGYKIIIAQNGEEAVRRVEENRGTVSLVLLDVIMPVKNGREAHEEIKGLEPGIRAIFMSGYTDDILSRKGILEEDFDFISKPINPDTLMRKIRDVMDR